MQSMSELNEHGQSGGIDLDLLTVGLGGRFVRQAGATPLDGCGHALPLASRTVARGAERARSGGGAIALVAAHDRPREAGGTFGGPRHTAGRPSPARRAIAATSRPLDRGKDDADPRRMLPRPGTLRRDRRQTLAILGR